MPDMAVLPAPWDVIGWLLLLGVALLLVGGFLRHPYDDLRQGRMPKRTQLPQTVLLVALAVIVWLAAARQTALAGLGLFVGLGVALGFLGDLFMADVFRQKDHVLFGMAAFGAGHVCYMLGFREIALAFSLHAVGAYAIALLFTWAAAIILWLLMIRSPTGEAGQQYAALAYALFLASMAGYALGLALQRGVLWPLAAGGLLFLLSDALIAARLFGGHRFRYMGDVIWATYILAQALIVTAVPAVLALLRAAP